MNPTRRGALTGLLAGTATAAAAFVASAEPAGDDAELINLCQQFCVLVEEERTYYQGGPNYIEDDEERGKALEPIDKQQRDILDRIYELRAATPQGIIARVHALAVFYAGTCTDTDCYDDQMIAALCRDADAQAGRASA